MNFRDFIHNCYKNKYVGLWNIIFLSNVYGKCRFDGIIISDYKKGNILIKFVTEEDAPKTFYITLDSIISDNEDNTIFPPKGYNWESLLEKIKTDDMYIRRTFEK